MPRVKNFMQSALLILAAIIGVLLIYRSGQSGATLLVHAGAGIRPPLDKLGEMFQKETGVRVDYSYKGSGCLLADICLSKKGDVYIPGETFYMQQAKGKKFITKDRIVAGMTTVLIVQKGNPKKIRGLKDLSRPGLRLGMGDWEAVAAGKAAREALTRAGVFKEVQKNLVMSALNVIELGNAVKLGHLDAAIVWDATAALYKKTEMETISLPDEHRVYSPIPVGVLTFSKHPKEAERFMNFLASDSAAKVFQEYGYSVSKKKAPAAEKKGKA